ncbi:MAG: TetR/AcrR family transcriptional regulator [Bacteroidia bacterium]
MDTKTKILFAAQELFFKYGIKRITMDDIAKHLAVSKKTIYQFFEDKNLIVDSLCDISMKENECSFRKLAESSKDPIHEMIEVAKHMTTVFSRINPVFFYDLQRYYPQAWKRFQGFKNGLVHEMLEKNLKEGISLGYYRKDQQISMLAKYRIHQVDLALSPEVFLNEEFSISQVNSFLLDHFMHGITTIKGHRLINKYKQIEEE